MPETYSLTSTRLWPTLGQTLEEYSRKRALTRESFGAGVAPRSLDRMNGMERTGAPGTNQALFGGIVAGDNMDHVINGNFMPRDAILQTTDIKRGSLTPFLDTGILLDTQV